MSVGRTWAVSLLGIHGAMVEVEADISQSLPRLVIIGLADRSLGEAEGRVRLAATNSGCRLPTGRITVNLSPAGLPKAGAGFDLAIALACLAADARLPLESVARVVHLGELGLDGRLRATRGILPAVLAARDAGFLRIMVPAANGPEAQLVPGVEIIPIESLRAAAIWHGADLEPIDDPRVLVHAGTVTLPGDSVLAGAGAGEPAGAPVASAAPASPGEPGRSEPAGSTITPGGRPGGDMEADGAGATLGTAPRRLRDSLPGAEPSLADVIGQDVAVDALTTAAAGGHHLGMIGPPGAGKSMLAARLPSLLPDLSLEEALEVAAVRSVNGDSLDAGIPTRPPWEAPHHSASVISIIGGGSALIRPGAAARAAHGVLFLDEAAEFPSHVLDTLRQPLETGEIVIHRAIGAASFPGRFQLILAANPCPCGYYDDKNMRCRCPAQNIRRYQARLSGPLLDRIDIRIRVNPLTLPELRLARDSPHHDHAAIRTRIHQARDRARHRLRDTPWTQASEVPGSWLREGPRQITPEALSVLDHSLARGRLSMRGYDRVLRVAWTVADLAEHGVPTADDVSHALDLREGFPT
ncbi:YifB family Mg chelatase-like AAA ATPase [Mycetocola sp. JXN-3]|uniref:YifB family Mg chelatase-like AAA ATPase n=1 Tax=Mycetocola sp. JXN-3 TaxID=2116510 RepID=UPI00165CF681|nr:ATP-binding protein [Mycetocola sp. JXN-3]